MAPCIEAALSSRATAHDPITGASVLRSSAYVQGLRRVAAKIGFDNLPSQRLFTKLGYKEHSRSQVFRETTFTLEINEATKQWLQSQLPPSLSYETYE